MMLAAVFSKLAVIFSALSIILFLESFSNFSAAIAERIASASFC
jgi:hypothetical protein